jgi:organic radical activating enzyme
MIIETDSLEIFKQNYYILTPTGRVSNNAYLSIVVTNKCQCRCSYCINSETNHIFDLPIDKAITNIKNIVHLYSIKEAILLGGEPTLHPHLFELLKKLREDSGLKFIRITTNGIKLKNNSLFIKNLVDKKNGVQGVNISFHNENFLSFDELEYICKTIKFNNPNIKIRINSNIWRNNLDNISDLLNFLDKLNFVDEIRLSNLIPKDSFSVNSINNSNYIGLSIKEYNNFFTEICDYFSSKFSLINNNKTLGFVRYVLIPTKIPIIINWNTYSTVSKQICENDISTRQINTFKCLVNGNISLSWNENNTIN